MQMSSCVASLNAAIYLVGMVLPSVLWLGPLACSALGLSSLLSVDQEFTFGFLVSYPIRDLQSCWSQFEVILGGHPMAFYRGVFLFLFQSLSASYGPTVELARGCRYGEHRLLWRPLLLLQPVFLDSFACLGSTVSVVYFGAFG